MDYIQNIVEKLKIINPQKIILFGSRADESSESGIDIDLLVVTGDDFIPTDFSGINSIYLAVSNLLTDIEREIPIDLIVHTKPMHQKFIEMESSFSKVILGKGKVLYEKNC